MTKKKVKEVPKEVIKEVLIEPVEADDTLVIRVAMNAENEASMVSGASWKALAIKKIFQDNFKLVPK